MRVTNTTFRKYFRLLYITIITAVLSIAATSCGLFDKEIEQDKHIANFRHQMIRVQDSLDTHKSRIVAYQTILENINNDKNLITPRKKNILLMEGNAMISNEYLEMEDFKKAIEYVNIIISIDSTSPRGFYSRGCIYQTMEKDSLAVLDYNKAIRLNSDYTDAYYNRGIIHEGLGNYEKALSDYNKAIDLKPPYITDIYNNRGNTYLAQESFDKAIDDYTKVIRIDSTNVKAYSNRAGAYIQQEKYDQALADCDKAIRLDPTGMNAYIKRASIFEEKKKYEEAIDDYETIMKLDPQNRVEAYEMSKNAIRRLKPLVKKSGK